MKLNFQGVLGNILIITINIDNMDLELK